MAYEELKLENQLCFPVYAASRLILRQYQPLLSKLNITYPQYLVLLVLWEKDKISVNEIADKLILNTNTITPLLKRMQNMDLINKRKSKSDERKTIISLTKKGSNMIDEAIKIPQELINNINTENISAEELIDLKNKLNNLIEILKDQNS